MTGMIGTFESFDHTADVGFVMESATLEGLFEIRGAALFSLIVEDSSTVDPAVCVVVELEEEDLNFLFFDWMAHLLSLFTTRSLVLSRFEVTFTPRGLRGVCQGEPVALDKHRLEHEVKAITYHGLEIKQTAAGYTARVVMDI